MAGLIHGTKYRRGVIEQFPPLEGVFKSSLSGKWVVRVKDTHNPYQQYRSLSQSSTQAGAEKLFNDYKSQ